MSSFRLKPSLESSNYPDTSDQGMNATERFEKGSGISSENNEIQTSDFDQGSDVVSVRNTSTDSGGQLHVIKASIEDLKQEKESFLQNPVYSIPPAGLSRKELNDWRLNNAKEAKRHLLELEQRIQRLQIMSRNLAGLTSGNNKAEQINRNLPELTEVQPFRTIFEDPRRMRADGDRPSLVSTNLLSTIRSPAMNLTTIRSPAMRLTTIRNPTMLDQFAEPEVSPVSEANENPQPTLALSEIRQLLHDEMSKAISEQPNPNSPLEDRAALTDPPTSASRSHNAGGKTRPPAKQRPDSEGAELAQFFREELLADEDAGGRGGIRYEDVVFPRSLHEAKPRSLRLLCGGFSRQSPVRIKCFQIYLSPAWNTFFALVSVANAALIGLIPESSGGVQDAVSNPYEDATARFNSRVEDLVGFSAVQGFDYACVGLLGFEVATGCIAVGLVSVRSAWLRCSDLHKLELFVLLSAVGEFVGAYFGFRSISLRPILLVRVLKPILRFGSFVGMRVILAALYQARPTLAFAAMFLLFSLSVFCIIGMTIMQNSFRRVCLAGETLIPNCASDARNDWNATCEFERSDQYRSVLSTVPVVADGYPFFAGCKIFKNKTVEGSDFVFDKIGGYYHDCKVGRCVEQSKPVFNFVHFDHVGGALLAVLQALGANHFEDVLNLSLQSEPFAKPVVWVFWASVTAFCTVGMQNLLKAVVVVHIRFARSLHADHMFQVAGSANPPQRVAQDGFNELDDSLSLRPPSAQISRRQSDIRNPPGIDKQSGDKVMQNTEVYLQDRKSIFDKGSMKESEADDILAGEDLSDGKVQRAALLILNDWKICRLLDIAIASNTVAVAVEQWDAPDYLTSMAYFAELTCTFIFFCETLLRFAMAGDFKNYWSSSSNRLELALILCAFGGFIFSSADFLLSFPTIRIYRLLLHFPTLKVLTHGCISSFRGIFTLSTVMITLGLAWAIMGRYLIGDKMNITLRANFGSFSDSLLTIFKLFVGDIWSTVLYAAMSTRTSMLGQAFVASFILFWVFCSKFIFSAMYIAIVIEHFQSADLIAAVRKADIIKYLLSFIFDSAIPIIGHINAPVDSPNDTKAQIINRYYFSKPSLHSGEDGKGRRSKQYLPPTRKTADLMLLLSYSSTDHGPEDDALYMQKPPPKIEGHFVRNLCITIVSSRYYQLLLVIVILASSLVLISTPANKDLPTSNRDWTLFSYKEGSLISDIITILFTLEFVLNAIVYGLVRDKGSVLRSAWGIADLVVLIFAWIEFLDYFQDGMVAKIFRLIRVISPFFRFVKRFRTLREIFERVMSSSAPLLYVSIYSAITMGVFALIGMSLFGGKMFRCTSLDIKFPSGKVECCGASLDVGKGFLEPRAWVRPAHNFDTAYFAFLTLFRVATFDLQETVDDAADITGVDSNPLLNNNAVSAIFFVIYIILDPGQNFNIFLSIQNAIFFGELCLEILLYVIAEGPGVFLEDGWRVFELILALGSAYGYTQTARIDGDLSPISVLFQVYAVFALIGVELFSTTKYGQRLGPTANFATWFSAIKTLFQIFVGDDWTALMDDCSVQPPSCTPQFSKVYMYGYQGPFYSFGDCGLQYASTYFLAVKMICEFVLINLLIGIFLKNFHFLHDEMMQQEDEFWSHGASARQIIELTEIFDQFDQQYSPFTLSRLGALKLLMPYPLGLDMRRKRRMFMFKHDKTGQAAWLLIRAELNVLVRGRRFASENIIQRFLRTVSRCFRLQYSKTIPEALGFHETMMTVFRWRMPLMVPQSVKQGRIQLIPEIVLTAYALTIFDFLWNCVSIKRRKAIKARLSFVIRVRNWCLRDAPYSKRMELLHSMNWTKIKDLKKSRQSSARTHISSHGEFFNLLINPIDFDDYRDSYLSHQEAFDEFSVENRTASTGIQVFRSKLKHHAVVLKFVDPLNKHRGCFVADFTGFKWIGWTCLESPTDAVLQLTASNFSTLRKIGLNTQKVECFIHLGETDHILPDLSLKGKDFSNIPELEPFQSVKCSLIDIHAFETADHRAERGIRQVLRFNLGPGIETPSHLLFDGVMEVLGYVLT